MIIEDNYIHSFQYRVHILKFKTEITSDRYYTNYFHHNFQYSDIPVYICNYKHLNIVKKQEEFIFLLIITNLLFKGHYHKLLEMFQLDVGSDLTILTKALPH